MKENERNCILKSRNGFYLSAMTGDFDGSKEGAFRFTLNGASVYIVSHGLSDYVTIENA